MDSEAGTERETLARQAELFRLAERDHGLTLTALAAETGIGARTLATYANSNPFARAKMPLWVFVKLCAVMPDEVTSVVMPAGKYVGTDAPDDASPEALARETAGFTADYMDRAADGKLCHIDRAALRDRARRIAPKARAVAA